MRTNLHPRTPIAICALALCCTASGQNNIQLDPQFGNAGIARTSMWPSSSAWDMAVHPDGKILVAGTADTLIALARYNPDGTLDPTFDGDGLLTADGIGNASVQAMKLQSDGRIVLAGTALVNGTWVMLVARFDANGALDSGFELDGVFTVPMGVLNASAKDIAIAPDGRIVAVGTCYQPGGQPMHSEMAVLRLNTDGSLDTTFDNDGLAYVLMGSNAEARAVALQPDGSTLIGGCAVIGYNNWDFALARLLTDGSLDPAFGNAGVVNTENRPSPRPPTRCCYSPMVISCWVAPPTAGCSMRI